MFVHAAAHVLNLGCSVWNILVGMSFEFLGKTPMNFNWNVWNAVSDNLYPIFAALGATLLVLFFCIGYVRSAVDIRHSMTLENSMLLFIRLLIAAVIFASLMVWMRNFFGWAARLATALVLNGSSINSNMTQLTADNILGYTPPSGSASAFETAVAALQWLSGEAVVNLGQGIGLIVMAFIASLVMIVASFTIAITCFKRFFNLYLLMLAAPIAISTLAGGNEVSNTGRAFIKTFLGIVFECVVISIVLQIGMVMINNAGSMGSTVTDATSSPYMTLIKTMLCVGMTSAAVKGADTFIRRAFAIH